MTRYQREILKLYELQKFGIKLGLNSTQNLLHRLGNPHHDLKCLHLAGTNGKGSVGAMCESALLDARVRAGMYTSPHLERFSERFRIQGREITQKRTLHLINQVWGVADPGEPPTFFEFVTAMAFLYFAQEGVEWVVLETGLGGRLDATNVCRPAVCVITNIGLEHQEFLGKTLRSIAFEKAGIIKRKVPLVHGVKQSSARKEVEYWANLLDAPVIRTGRELRFRRRQDLSFNLKGRIWNLKGLRTNLLGRHQSENAALALGALEVLSQAGCLVGPSNFTKGLTRVCWPGRLEQIPTPPNSPSLWLDGAHNLAAARTLIANLDTVRGGRSPLVMVVGVMADKDVAEILGVLLPPADQVVFTRPVYERAADPETLARQAPSHCPPSIIERDLGKAVAKAIKLAGKMGVVLITGSLFTVGEARTLLVK